MDSAEVRRVWLRCGGSASAAARELGTTRQAVEYHVARANTRSPLTAKVSGIVQTTSVEDRDAVNAYLRAALERAGIQRP